VKNINYKAPLYTILSRLIIPFLSQVQILSSKPFSNIVKLCSSLWMRKFHTHIICEETLMKFSMKAVPLMEMILSQAVAA
jgi:hypothetical protein